MTYLNKLASLLGRPLRVDTATLDFRRLSVARVLVKLDVSKSPMRRLCIGDGHKGLWQKIKYEFWPNYCSFCKQIGHL